MCVFVFGAGSVVVAILVVAFVSHTVQYFYKDNE